MTQVPRFLVDPVLVTMPQAADGPAAMEKFLLALQSWLRERKVGAGESWGHFFACTQRLLEARRFPTFQALRQAVRLYGLDVNVAYINQLLSAFFEDEAHDFSARTTTRYVLGDPEPRFEPQTLIERNLPQVRPELCAALLCIAADSALGVADASASHLVTAPLTPPTEDRALRVLCRVALTEPDRVLPALPAEDLDQQIRLLFSPTDLCDLLGAEIVLVQGPEVFLQAIRLRAQRERPDSQQHAASVGPTFWRSLEDSHIRTDLTALDKLLRVCVAVILDLATTPGLHLRQFRESAAPNARQRCRVRDSARAWRVTITTAGVGWRMNYWLLPGPPTGVEFAVVQRKQDGEHIPE